MVESLSEFVRSKRGDLSLREFSERCDGLSHTQIDSIERGEDPRTGKVVRPTVDTLAKLSKGTGASVAFLAALANGDDTDNLISSQEDSELLHLFKQLKDKYKMRLLGAAYAIFAEQNFNTRTEVDKLRTSVK